MTRTQRCCLSLGLLLALLGALADRPVYLTGPVGHSVPATYAAGCDSHPPPPGVDCPPTPTPPK